VPRPGSAATLKIDVPFGDNGIKAGFSLWQGGFMIDWTNCDIVESVPGKVSGKPIVKGTRILADTIVQDYELGASLDEIQESFPSLPLETIKKLLAFAHSKQLVP
jgi:uncharacterized protein (DUF433 family)